MPATAAGAPLRFDILADKSQFSRTVEEARAEFRTASTDMAQSAGGVGNGFLDTATKIGQSIGGLAEQMRSALDKGAAGVEQGLLTGLKKVEDATKSFLNDSLASLGEKYFGKLGERTGKVFAGMINSTIDPAVKGALEKLSENEGFTSWVDSLIPKVKSLASEFDTATNAAGSLSKRFEALVEGAKSAIDVKLGRALPIEEFEAIIGVLDKEIARRERVIELIGKTAEEQAKLRLQFSLEDAGANLEGMSPAQRAAFDEKEAEVGKAAAREEGARQAVSQRRTFEQITAQLVRQAELAKVQVEQFGLGAGQLAEQRAIQEAMLRMRSRGRELSAEELAIVKEQAAALGQATQAAQLAQALRASAMNAQRSVRNSELDQSLVGAAPGQVAEARAVANDLQRMRELNLALTPEIAAGFRANAESIGAAAQAAANARTQLEQIREAGSVVARSLEGAFASFVDGTKINFRSLVTSMIADMAQLTFRQQVLQPLFGGGGAAGGGLLGNALSGMFRADGGPVSAGQPYIVGEKRPELFIPQSAGTIVPQVPMSQPSRSTNLALTINAPNSTPDSVKLLQAQLPSIILSTLADARERGAYA
tara:strand:- start:14250 stop:16037 length:1788 start_codon:yes stop_codon:yes gene_type:complete